MLKHTACGMVDTRRLDAHQYVVVNEAMLCTRLVLTTEASQVTGVRRLMRIPTEGDKVRAR
jgi:hypothetical protein